MVHSFRSEWLKICRPGMLLGGAGSLCAAALLGILIAIFRADQGRGPLTVALLSQADGFAAIMQRSTELIGIVALGTLAIAMAQDYAHGTLRSLLVGEPRRLRLLAGKLGANLLFTALGIVAATAVALVAALLAAPSRGIDTSGWVGYGLGTTLSTTGDLVLAGIGYGVIGALLAIVLRSPAPAVIAGIAWALPVEGLLVTAWDGVGRWLPSQQLSAIATHGTATISYTTALVRGGVVVALAATVALAIFQRRDVTT